MTTFNIVEDTEIIRDNGFFCEACLIGKSFSEHSPDTRYCKGCYEVLQNEKVALTDYWCENGAAFAHYGKKYSIDKSLKTICVGEAAKTIAKEKPVSPEKPPVDCASFANCSAPLCPMNASSLLRGIWYISEPICGKKGKPEWIRTQNKVAKKATDSTRYFTYQQLLKMKRVAKPRGKNPDSPLKVDISNNRRGKKTKGKVSSAIGSRHYTLCPICDKPAKSPHHIKPLRFDGKDTPKNIIYLCFSCHNEVEELADTGKYLTPRLIKIMRLRRGI